MTAQSIITNWIRSEKVIISPSPFHVYSSGWSVRPIGSLGKYIIVKVQCVQFGIELFFRSVLILAPRAVVMLSMDDPPFWLNVNCNPVCKFRVL